MKHRFLAALALCFGAAGLVSPVQPVAAVASDANETVGLEMVADSGSGSTPTKKDDMCPKGSLRNPNGSNPNPEGVTNRAQCNIPEAEKDEAGNEKGVMYFLNLVINVVLAVVGIIAVIMIILGGISFITSQGDTAKTTKARNTILYGIVGLVIALLAFAIVNFVLTGIFGSN